MIEIFCVGLISGVGITLLGQLLWFSTRDSLKAWIIKIIKENKNEPEKKI